MITNTKQTWQEVTAMLKIYWNGIKANDRDKLQRCDYTLGIINDPRMISVFARDYTGFSSEVRNQIQSNQWVGAYRS